MSICSACGNKNNTTSRFCSWCGKVMGSNTYTGLLPAQSLLHNGRYLIIERVGMGGMGAVYKAMDLSLSRRVVAVKEMSQSGLSPQELQDAVKSFAHEAEILSRLKHQSLPHIYEQFEEHGRYYLAMEFIEGQTLERILELFQKQGKQLPLIHIVNLCRCICDVLDYLHTQTPPIIFRDLKPSNIIVHSHNRLHLIDFGIARIFKQGQTKDTTALGSEGYAPPEQYSQATSPRSDIYSLGATLHQMLTGDDPSQNPFHFRPFSVKVPRLERLVMSMVALDEQYRPARAKDVLQALNDLIPSQQKNTVVLKETVVISKPLKVYIVISAAMEDQKLWTDLKDQLQSLITAFPKISIEEGFVAQEKYDREQARAIDTADLVLLLVSKHFLSSDNCMANVNQALDNKEKQGTPVFSILLSPCAWTEGSLGQIKTISNNAIAHMSLYAQEQKILEVAKSIRKLLAILIGTKKTGGHMNLLQWLLWQLYGNGRASCAYFLTGKYALRTIRSSGLAAMLIQLLDLRENRVIGEYIISLHDKDALNSLLHIIAPTITDAEMVPGIASRDKSSKLTVK